MAEEKKKPEHKSKHRKGLHEMHIRKAASGGFIAKHPDSRGRMNHDGADAETGENLQHVLPDMEGLHDHMEQHMGGAEPGEAAPGAEPEPQE